VKIEIYDQSYNVNAEDSEEYLKELAAYVDGQQEIEGPLRKRVEKCVSMVEKALEQTN
jgi:hypothetical protein